MKRGRCGRGIKTHITIVKFCQFRIQQSTVTVIIVCTLFSCAVTSDTMHFSEHFVNDPHGVNVSAASLSRRVREAEVLSGS